MIVWHSFGTKTYFGNAIRLFLNEVGIKPFQRRHHRSHLIDYNVLLKELVNVMFFPYPWYKLQI